MNRFKEARSSKRAKGRRRTRHAIWGKTDAALRAREDERKRAEARAESARRQAREADRERVLVRRRQIMNDMKKDDLIAALEKAGAQWKRAWTKDLLKHALIEAEGL